MLRKWQHKDMAAQMQKEFLPSFIYYQYELGNITTN